MSCQAGKISKIGPHVYVKGSAEAVRLYKEAFGLEDKGGTHPDKDGDIYHRALARNGEYFISVSEDKYMHDGLKREYPNGVRPKFISLAIYFKLYRTRFFMNPQETFF